MQSSSNPRSILYVDHTAALGGAEIALMHLLCNLDQKRWRPTLTLGSDGPLAGAVRNRGIQVNILAMPRALSSIRQGEISLSSFHPLRAMDASRYIVKLLGEARRINAKIIHANSWRACVLAGIVARLARIPCVWQVHAVAAPPMMSTVAVRFMRNLARLLPVHIVCNSNATAAPFATSSSRLSIIPCGVEAARFQSNVHAEGQGRVGMIARFAPIKGQHVFLDALQRTAAKHPSAQFVLAGTALFGEGCYEDGVRDAASRTGLGARVQFPGFVSDVPGLLQSLDIVVHPSTGPEGFGQIVAEAMMAGKPVVASSAGGTAEVIDDGVTGCLVPPGDAAALAEAIDYLLTHPDEAAEMGARARNVALERYDIRKTTRAIEDVYEMVLARA